MKQVHFLVLTGFLSAMAAAQTAPAPPTSPTPPPVPNPTTAVTPPPTSASVATASPASATSSAVPEGEIQGVVLRPDGKPAPKARIAFTALVAVGQAVLPPSLVSADELGVFRFETQGRKEFSVRAHLAPFAPVSRPKVVGGQRLTLTLPSSVPLQGEVVDAQTAEPIAGAEIEGADWEFSPYFDIDPDFAVARARTDARGRFTLLGVSAAGRPVVKARARGFATERLAIASATAEPLKFRLGRGHDLTGTITDGSEHPIARATVTLRGPSGPGLVPTGRTSTNGRFEIRGLKDVPYSALVVADGFAPATRDFMGPDVLSWNVTLDKGSKVMGRIVDEEGRPLKGAAHIQSHNGAPIPSLPGQMAMAQIGQDGVFSLISLRTGTTVFLLSGVGYPAVEKSVDITRAGETVNLGDVAFDAGLAIHGRVVEKGDVPVAGARITAVSRVGMKVEPLFVESDADGRFKMRGLTERPYGLSLMADTLAPLEASLSPSPDEQVLTMSRSLKLTGRVVNPEGEGISRAQVSAQRGDDRRSGRPAASATAGRFSLDLSQSGAVKVTIYAQGFENATRTVDVTGDFDMGDVVLSRGVRLRGVVVDSKGAAVIGARVENQGVGGSSPTSVETDEKGAFDLPGASPGPTRIVVGHRDYSPNQVTVDVPEKEAGAPEPLRIVLTKGGRVDGSVRYRDGRPVAQAQVQIVRQGGVPRVSGSAPNANTTTTGADGSFVIERLYPGPAKAILMAGQNGQYVSVAAEDVTIEEGATSSVALVLRPTVVRGSVRRGGEPASGLRVSVLSSFASNFFGPESTRSLASPIPWTSASTDAQGQFALQVVGPLKGRAVVEGPERGQTAMTKFVDIPDVDEFPLDLEFGGTRIRGRVLEQGTNRPISYAQVASRLISKQGSDSSINPAYVATDLNGVFVLDVAPGEYQLSITADGFASTRQKVDATSAETPIEDILLSRGGTLLGRVLLPSGRPAAEAFARISDRSPPTSALTSVDGTFTLRGLTSESFTLTVTHGADLAVTHEIAATGTDVVEIRLAPGARVNVTLVGPPDALKAGRVFLRKLNNASYFGGVSAPLNAQGAATMVAPPGVLLISASSGIYSGEASVVGRPGETISVSIEMKPRK